MTKVRSVFDDAHQTTLVFPDLLLIRKLTSKASQHLTTTTLMVSFNAPPTALESLPNARQIRLSDVETYFSAPKDGLVTAFDFVRGDPLHGTIVMQCLNSDVAQVLLRLGAEVGYLSPRYKGTSEEFWAKTVIAEMQVDVTIANAFNEFGAQGNLVQLVEEAIFYAKKAANTEQLARELVNKLISSLGTIKIVTEDTIRKLLIEVSSGTVQVERLLENVRQIFGDKNYLTARLEQ